MNSGWYYSNESSASDELVDKFADSKFGIDRWSSFAREIIQNSLDAQDDEKSPVEVTFELNKLLALNDIPDGETIKYVLGQCAERATNKQTKSAYLKGLDILSKDKVYCLKISDKNTKGVKTGRDEAWGALVFDEGKSIKQRPGSAGSHGVGKKVPFIISSCNTVFYATKNKYNDNGEEKSDCLVQGKTTLINWIDSNGNRKHSKGWYGLIDENAIDSKNAIMPIDVLKENRVHPFFKRTDEYGTDVIIIGTNIYENESEIKQYIISAILENFFVAILESKLVVSVFGEEITANNFHNMVNKYYIESGDNKNNLIGCLRVYDGDPSWSEAIADKNGKELGKIYIYFGVGNEHNKKYYTIVRSHGMRIKDNRVNKASQPYTAVVFIEGKDLNETLAVLENAAHDDFVTQDENMEIDKDAIWAYDRIRSVVSSYIEKMTKIDSTVGQEIEGLNNIITLPGVISSVKKKTGQPEVKRNSVSSRGKGSKSKDYKQGKNGAGEGNKKRKSNKGKNKPAKKGGEIESILYDEYNVEPIFMKTNSEYILKFSVSEDINKADLLIRSINSEGKYDDSISDYIESVVIDGTRRKCMSGRVTGISLKKEKLYSISVILKNNVTYQLSADLFVKEEFDE